MRNFTHIRLTDVNGRLVNNVMANAKQMIFSLTGIENGIYFIQLFDVENTLTHTQKLVVNK